MLIYIFLNNVIPKQTMTYITQTLGFNSSTRLLLLGVQMQYWLMSVNFPSITLIQASRHGSKTKKKEKKRKRHNFEVKKITSKSVVGIAYTSSTHGKIPIRFCMSTYHFRSIQFNS